MEKQQPNCMLKRPVIVIALLSFTVLISAQFSGGQGTLDDPWIIETMQDLADIRAPYMSDHFLQVTDICLVRIENWEPIGQGWDTDATSFRGVYDGGGHVISDLTVNRPNPGAQEGAGLFGSGASRWAEPMVIKNLGLIDVNIIGGNNTGALIGRAQYNVHILNCYVVGGTVRGQGRTGGLIGNADTQEHRGLINGCFSDVEVIGGNQTGGLIGFANSSDVRNSYSLGSVSNLGDRDIIGGLIGVHNFYAAGHNLENCYSIARVNPHENQHDMFPAGGLVGHRAGMTWNNPPDVSGLYWNTQTSGLNYSLLGVPRTSLQMIYPYTDNTYADYDFEDIWVHDETRNLNRGYPYLAYQQFPAGLDAPEVTIEKTLIDDVLHIRLSWQPVQDASSYIIYASDDPYTNNWGEPLRIVGGDETQFAETIGANNLRFYRVTASPEAP